MEVEPDVIDVPMVEAQLEAAPVPPPSIQVRTRAEQIINSMPCVDT